MSRNLMSALSPLFYKEKHKWVNGINAIQYHHNKPLQLAHAKRLGAQIPPTYIGNNIEHALTFLALHSDAIVKPVHGGVLTRRLTKQDKENLPSLLSNEPLTLQACIGGKHIRTFVLGESVFSAIIESEHLDYRSDGAATLTNIQLSSHEDQLARLICKHFDMKWCAIDWKYDNDQLVFLEANPSPQFVAFEDVTGYPITEELVALLLGSS